MLEYREFWEDIDNDKIGKEYAEEFKDYQISSIRNAKGERAYYKKLKYFRDNCVLDLANDDKEADGDPLSIKLSFSEKYLSGKVIRNRNEYFINKSRSFALNLKKEK